MIGEHPVETQSMNSGLVSAETSPTLKISYRPWLVSACLLAGDLLAIIAAFLTAYYIRQALIPVMGGVLTRGQIQPLAVMIVVFVPTIMLFSGSYPGHGRAGFVEFRRIVLDVSLAYITVGVASFILGYGFQFSRLVFLISWVLALFLVVISRVLLRNGGPSITWWSMPAVVVGQADELAAALVSLRASRRIGFKAAAALVLGPIQTEAILTGVPAFEFSPGLLPLLRNQGIRLALVASPTADLDHSLRQKMNDLSSIFPRVVYVTEDPALNVVQVNQALVAGRPTFEVQNKLLSPSRRLLKRVSDLLLCLLGASVGLPLFLFLAALIAVDSRGHVLYRQKRVGLDGRIFDIYKFRTMQVGAEEALDALLATDPKLREEFEARHKMQADPRITKVGRILRRFSFDEFPQFWNVIRGEMSIVGPRPYLPSEIEEMGEAREVILRVLPGLTGWWQVMGRHRLEFTERLRMDRFYVGNYSMLTDLYIMFKTAYVILSGEGI
jgi:Undecaprenyl-phosphate galactose phosphotransferase WbaP